MLFILSKYYWLNASSNVLQIFHTSRLMRSSSTCCLKIITKTKSTRQDSIFNIVAKCIANRCKSLHLLLKVSNQASVAKAQIKTHNKKNSLIIFKIIIYRNRKLWLHY